jgi:hypothetical protein
MLFTGSPAQYLASQLQLQVAGMRPESDKLEGRPSSNDGIVDYQDSIEDSQSLADRQQKGRRRRKYPTIHLNRAGREILLLFPGSAMTELSGSAAELCAFLQIFPIRRPALYRALSSYCNCQIFWSQPHLDVFN